MAERSAFATIRWHPAVLLLSGPHVFPVPERNPLPGRGARFAARAQYFLLAQEARGRNRPEEMLAHLREALRYRATWGVQEPLEDALADGLLELGRVDEAIAEYERALSVFPGMALARYRLAGAYRAKGNVRAAQQNYRKFLDLWKHADPSLPELMDAQHFVD